MSRVSVAPWLLLTYSTGSRIRKSFIRTTAWNFENDLRKPKLLA